MTVTFGNQTYFRTTEACRMAGIGRSTLVRWMHAGILEDSVKRDRRGWRLFSREDIDRILQEAHKVE